MLPHRLRRVPRHIGFIPDGNRSWERDLACARYPARRGGRASLLAALGSRDVSRVDLVVRWGGRRRSSGFLPIQRACADFCTIDTLWPDMNLEEASEALAWYDRQDVTMGG